jgi:hypothetical protein
MSTLRETLINSAIFVQTDNQILYNINIKIQESGRMKQLSFSDIEYSNRRKKTKREEFLESMDEIIPWSNWVNIIMPYY